MNQWKEITADDSEVWDRLQPIEGKLIAVRHDVGPNGSKMYTLQTKDGTKAVWGSTVLDTKFEQIRQGSMVRIEPLGEVVSEKTKRKYQDFKVFCKPPEFEEVLDPDEQIPTDDVPPEFLKV